MTREEINAAAAEGAKRAGAELARIVAKETVEVWMKTGGEEMLRKIRIGIDPAKGHDRTSVALFKDGRMVGQPSVIPTRRSFMTRLRDGLRFVLVGLWIETRIMFTQLELWLDERYLKRARRDGILESGSESLHAAEARLAQGRIRLALLITARNWNGKR